MASTFSPLKIELIGTGEKVGTWGTTTNINLGTALEEAITGSADVTFASGTVTLTLTDVNTTQSARNLRLNLIGTSGGAQNLIVPAIEKLYLINNACADAITVKNSTGTGIAVPAGKSMFVYNNATNVVDAVTYATGLAPTASPTFTGTVTIPTPFTLGAVSVLPTGTELNYVDGVTSNIQTQLNTKAPTASPTFTGTVTIPTPFTLGAVSVLPTGTELNYVDGVTSNIQTQLNAKAATAGPTFTGTVTTDVLTTTGQLNLTGDLVKTRSESGADSLISVNNTSNTANSGVNFLAAVAGTSAGDAWSSYSVTGTAAWSVGIDNSDSDKFKISNFLSLGTNDYFSISATGAISVGGSFGRGAPVNKTADFIVADTENWLINNKSGADCTVTLPSAAAYPGREIMFINYQAFALVSASSNVVPRGGGAAGTSIIAAVDGGWATLVSNGTNWLVMQGS